MNKMRKIIFISLSAAAFLVAVFLSLPLINSGNIARGVESGGINLGGKSFSEARNILQEKISNFQKQKIVFLFENERIEITPIDLGFSIDAAETVKAAAAFGRNSNLATASINQLYSLVFGEDIPLKYSLDYKKFNETLKPILSRETPAQNAKFSFNYKTQDFDIIPEKTGQIINREKLTRDILANLDRFSNSPVVLSLIGDDPQITQKILESKKDEALNLINRAPLILRAESLSWQIEKQQLADWVIVEKNAPRMNSLSLQENEIKDMLSSLVPAINREPVNAKLTWNQEKVQALSPAQEGKKLDIEESAREIQKEILDGKTEIYLRIDSVAAEINDENIQTLGLNSLLGRGESDFAGSSGNRSQNIKVGATKLNGLLLKPGQEFSFGEAIGEISQREGYLPEIVIKKNQLIPEYGGGICQVSTTVFRAAVNSGMKVTQRHPHAFVVSYYNPIGFDATVYPPNPDLKFINDTPGHLLIQSKIEGTKITFEFYGTADGRETKVIGPKILESKPDGSMKTVITQEIWRNGALERKNSFYSNYKSPSLYAKPSPSPTPTPTP